MRYTSDLTVPTAASAEKTLYYDLANNKLVEQTVSAAKNGPLTNSGHFSFAGLEDAYFTVVVLPEGDANMQQVTFADTMQATITAVPSTKIGTINRIILPICSGLG